jgi:CBS domain containing-hemolysin-like protein
MEVVAYLLLVVACLVLSAFFSGSETALLRIRHDDLKRDVKDALSPSALAARDLLHSTSRLLVTILFGNNIANILGASVASALAVTMLGPRWGIAVATVVMTLTVFLFCEVLPKAVAARHPRRIAYLVALPLYLFHQALRPLHLLYDRMIEPMVRAFAGGGADSTGLEDREELLRLARETADESTHSGSSPIGIIGSAARAAEMTVEDIMVPRPEIVAYPIDTPPNELLDAMLQEGYTRVPIYEGDIDKVLGVAHLKDVVGAVRSGDDTGIHRILKPTLKIPERKPILELLSEMQRLFVHLAIVQDEFGVTQGIVTQEDILEELVGEIRDEFDRHELESIRKVSDGRYQAFGQVKVLDFNRETGEQIDAESGDTLAGIVFNTLGRVPRRGESAHIPGYEIVVTDLTRNRVNQVQVLSRPETLGASDDRAATG